MSAVRASLFEPFTEIDLPLADRRDGKVRASWACGDEQRLIVTTDRLSAFDRVLAGVPYKGQVLNELSAWWFEQHRRRDRQPRDLACPTRTRCSPAPPRRCPSRSSCAATSPASPTRRCGACTATAPARCTATSSPTGCARTRRCPSHIVTPDDQGRARRPRRAAVVRRRRRARPAARRPVGAGDGGGLGDLRPRRRRRRARPG